MDTGRGPHRSIWMRQTKKPQRRCQIEIPPAQRGQGPGDGGRVMTGYPDAGMRYGEAPAPGGPGWVRPRSSKIWLPENFAGKNTFVKNLTILEEGRRAG